MAKKLTNGEPAAAAETPAHERLAAYFGEGRWARIVKQARTLNGWDAEALHRLCNDLMQRRAAMRPAVAVCESACSLLIAIGSRPGQDDLAKLDAARKAAPSA